MSILLKADLQLLKNSILFSCLFKRSLESNSHTKFSVGLKSKLYAELWSNLIFKSLKHFILLWQQF